jgi:hypothetical protein
VVSHGIAGCARIVFRYLPASRVARPALLVLDDHDASPLSGDDAFQRKLQLAQLRWVSSSRDAAASLAENYVGVVRV